jgi:hypothetical protein
VLLWGQEESISILRPNFNAATHKSIVNPTLRSETQFHAQLIRKIIRRRFPEIFAHVLSHNHTADNLAKTGKTHPPRCRAIENVAWPEDERFCILHVAELVSYRVFTLEGQEEARGQLRGSEEVQYLAALARALFGSTSV